MFRIRDTRTASIGPQLERINRMTENRRSRGGRNTPFRSAAPRTVRPLDARGMPRGENKPRTASSVPADVKGEKIQKVLADAGVGSRRDMEQRIAEGRISVNGEPAHIGQRVFPTDIIRVDGRAVRRASVRENNVPRVLIYHKPAGEIVSRDDPEGRPTVFDHLPRMGGARWINVGRLDFNTEGLLIFTTDGALANYLMHPRNRIVREYAVRVQGTMSPEAKEALLKGVKLEDGTAKFATIEEGGGKGFNRWYNVTLSEGRNREVRRMFDAVGLPVSRLIRVKYGELELPQKLPRGKFEQLTPEETQAWFAAIGYKGGSDSPNSRNSAKSSETGAKAKTRAVDPLKSTAHYLSEGRIEGVPARRRPSRGRFNSKEKLR